MDKNGECGSVYALLGLYGKSIKQPNKLRFCPRCFNDELERLGEGYWHRLHQIPGVLVCEKHHCTLLDSTVFYKACHSNQYISANIDSLFPMAVPQALSENEFIHADALVRDIQWLLANHSRVRRVYLMHEGSFSKIFLSLLREKGLATIHGSIIYKDYREAFKSFYDADFLCKLGLAIDNEVKKTWIIKMCRTDKVPNNPLKYILLSQFLCGGLEAFIDTAEANNPEAFYIAPLQYKTANDTDKLRKYRAQWLEVKNKLLNGCQNDIRNQIPNVYTWLKRHDATWLKDNYPSPRKRGGNKKYVDWDARDQEIANKIQDAADKLRSLPGKPIKVSATKIGKIIGCGSLLLRKSNKLPKSMNELLEVVEDNHALRIRRIHWAINELESNGLPLTMWRVMKLAGIRDELWREYKTFILPLIENEF